MADIPSMQAWATREATFKHPHQLSKRRASTTSKKKGANTQPNTVEWTHELPSVEQLARVGFFFDPGPDTPDNVQCFLCNVKLDGWEATDDPLAEHLMHAPACAWAICLSVLRTTDPDTDEEVEGPLDPMSETLVAARMKTFEVGEGWPHEGKRGWRCKVSRMVEAGWTFDPGPGEEDGVTCWYCETSLSGWEPKDDAFEEHRRRKPECAFFALCERFGHDGPGKGKGGKGRVMASKGSRMSTQSVVSVAASEALSEAENEMAVDDSIMSNATTASQATIKGGKKKGGRLAKGGKGRKRANTVEEPEEEEVVSEPVPTRKSQVPGAFPDSSVLNADLAEPAVEATPPPPPTRTTRKGSRQAKQPDSTILEPSQADEAAPATKKPSRVRKAKAPQPEPEPTPEPEPEEGPMLEAEPEYVPGQKYDHRLSDVSAQLQEELEHSVSQHDGPDNESTPLAVGRPKRGVKRSLDGMVKRDGDGEREGSVVMGMKFPGPPMLVKKGPAKGKGKGGRKVSKQVAAAAAAAAARQEEEEAQALEEEQESGNWEVFSPSAEPEHQPESVPDVKQTVVKKAVGKAKKAPAAKKGKGKKTSSARSSKATITYDESEMDGDGLDAEHDLERDEREIEAELARMADEQVTRLRMEAGAVMEEQEKVEEYEASPLPKLAVEGHGDAEAMQSMEGEVQSVTHDILERMAEETPLQESHSLDASSSAFTNQRPTTTTTTTAVPTPSPNGSDKENHPSSLARPATAIKAPLLSPTKSATTRIPLAMGTPNQQLRLHSPTKGTHLASPTKAPLHLVSTKPWQPIDLDALLFPSPSSLTSPNTTAMTPGGSLVARFVEVSGGLTSPEKEMTVEAWVRWRAGKGEEEVRRRGEGMVSLFEREGGVGLGSLGGIVIRGE
ncbi:hypothetical protein LTR02_002530 [Friedmanniomyces endolithicus]|nr:hypothetical protein LTR94_003990 [Friedmanniomyces endolithicus]KAK0776313.1 hypothetical protein LTR59_014233 [Friedmanniomyces endolithicus]KAK0799328.1 hypothetical protein LTR38_007514 [Friedmanniomyces endolithicus]KAK0842597.1 hypothetical protein LTR03_009213 [Friedmanniomyces endolithicus]KAK0868569.1 hypothetical protein LTR87_014101 [Friedmanniomyces endolithicus]